MVDAKLSVQFAGLATQRFAQAPANRAPELAHDVDAFEDRPLQPITAEDIDRVTGQRPAEEKYVFRFGPSPTGAPHAGTIKTALANYLAARSLGDKARFVVRVEDTDPLKSKPEYVEVMKDTLQRLGMQWDGDIVFQSQRKALYEERLQQLIESGKAYEGPDGAVWFRMPTDNVVVMNDGLRGKVPINVARSDGTSDLVLRGKDGEFKFFFANVVDDIEQGVTHVIAGVDQLPNTAKRLPLFAAFGARPPQYFHTTLISSDEGGRKLSKSNGDPPVTQYMDEQGYAPEVMVSHIAQLGGGLSTEETLPADELAQHFDIHHLSTRTQARFSEAALRARNRQFMMQMTDVDLAEAIAPFAQRIEVSDSSGNTKALADLLGDRGLKALAAASKGRVSTFAEAARLGEQLLGGGEEDNLADRMPQALLEELIHLPEEDWSQTNLAQLLDRVSEHTPLSTFQENLRRVLTGSPAGLPLDRVLAILGRARVLERLRPA